MEPLDWLFLGLVSGGILSLVVCLALIILKILAHSAIRKLPGEKPASKRKRRQLVHQQSQLKRQSYWYTIGAVVFFGLVVLLIASATYSRSYVSTHLNQRDSEAIVTGYYLLKETQINLEKIQGDNPEKAHNTLGELTAKLAGYGVYRSSDRLSLNRQQALNRYYTTLKELGLNLSSQSLEALKAQETYDNYLADLKQLTETQQDLFSLFDVNEQALGSKK